MNIRVYRRDRMLESRVSPMLATLAYRPTEAAAPTEAAKRGPEFDSQSCCRPSKRAKSEAPSCRHICEACKCNGFPECSYAVGDDLDRKSTRLNSSHT